MTTKSFKGYRVASPITIELESPDGERKITTRCASSLPGSVFLELAGSVNAASGGQGTNMGEMDTLAASAAAAGAILKVLKMAILPEDWSTFKAFIDLPDNGITVETLAEIAGYLSEQFTARPPTLLPPSTPG
jgi:hypothetical protein